MTVPEIEQTPLERTGAEARWARLAGRAASLEERRTRPAGRAAEATSDGPAAEAAGAAARWRAAIAPGDEAFFARRLAWDGEAPDDLAWLAAHPIAPLPRWATLMAGALATPAPWLRPEAWALEGEDPLPFEAAFAPVVTAAWRELGPVDWLTEAGARGLRRMLAARLAEEATPTLLQAFEARRLDLGPPGLVAGPSSRSRYEAFCAELLDGGWMALFERFPVLARLMGTVTAQWLEAASELGDRYVADRLAIADRFAPGATLGRLAAVHGGLSDPHAGGRTVHRLRTESGLALMYKPRAMGLDAAFDDLLGWLAAEGLSLNLRPTARLDRGAWGWVECLEPAPCADEAAVRRYFRRAGMLLAVVYALKGMDFHAENVFAVGEHPVLIDLEGLLQPRLAEHEPPAAPFADAAAFARSLETSVLTTAMVTFPMAAGSQEQDWSGLADPLDAAVTRHRRWVEVNTDRMRLEDRPFTPVWQNLPRLGDEPCSARPHAREVVAGFEEAYAVLSARLDALLAPHGPIAAFAEKPVRFFFRTTRHYAQLLSRGRRPEFLTDGLDRSLVFDRLSRTYRHAHDRPERWALIRAEVQALEQSDLPCFPTTPAATHLHVGAADAVPLANAALADVTAHLRRLGPADGRLQARLTAMCLVPAAPAPAVPWPPAQDFEFRARGLELAERVAERAVRLDDGSACWLAHQLVSERPMPIRAPLGAGLWDGASGVALLLAAAHRLGGDPVMRHLALAAVATMRGSLVAHAARGGLWPADTMPVVGGALEALARLSTLLEAPELARDAAAVARAWGPATFAAVAHPDVSGGLAAVLRGLLAAHAASGEGDLLAVATAAGDRLLAMAPVGAAGDRRWPSVAGRPLAGMAHGASGVATVLVRLHEATGEARFLQAAREGLAYEDRVFDVATGNWPSERQAPGVEPVSFVSWCYGAPGVSMARLAALRHMPERAGELDRAIATTLAEPDHLLDFVCCGNFGRVEALLEAGRVLGRPEWVAAARRLAARRLPLVGLGPNAAGLAAEGDSTYLRGSAGIGYALLRLAEPDGLPCVLAGA